MAKEKRKTTTSNEGEIEEKEKKRPKRATRKQGARRDPILKNKKKTVISEEEDEDDEYVSEEQQEEQVDKIKARTSRTKVLKDKEDNAMASVFDKRYNNSPTLRKALKMSVLEDIVKYMIVNQLQIDLSTHESWTQEVDKLFDLASFSDNIRNNQLDRCDMKVAISDRMWDVFRNSSTKMREALERVCQRHYANLSVREDMEADKKKTLVIFCEKWREEDFIDDKFLADIKNCLTEKVNTFKVIVDEVDLKWITTNPEEEHEMILGLRSLVAHELHGIANNSRECKRSGNRK